MVKKIGGGTPKTPAIQSTKNISGAKVGEIGSIKSTSSTRSISGAKSAINQITTEKKQQFLQLIDEEADKLFNNSNISEKRKATIKAAVKMAIESGIIEEEKN